MNDWMNSSCVLKYSRAYHFAGKCCFILQFSFWIARKENMHGSQKTLQSNSIQKYKRRIKRILRFSVDFCYWFFSWFFIIALFIWFLRSFRFIVLQDFCVFHFLFRCFSIRPYDFLIIFWSSMCILSFDGECACLYIFAQANEWNTTNLMRSVIQVNLL